MKRVALALAAVTLAALACSRNDAGQVRVFAAASLTQSFTAIAREFEADHPGQSVQLQFAGTPTLVLQLREGAPADVFAAADTKNMAKVVALHLADAAPREFARNRLAIAVAKGNPKHLAGLADLARADLTVALCGPDVPAGRYAREALAHAALEVHPVSEETSVNALVQKVRLGEVDAGIVYGTDVRGDVEAVPIPDAMNVMASYPIVALTSGHDRAGGARFVEFVLSPKGRRILAAHGFELP